MMRTSSQARAPDKSRMHRLCLREVTWHTSTNHNPLLLSPLNPSSWSQGSKGMLYTLDIIMGPLKHYMSDLQGMFHTLDITMVFLKCYQSDPLDSCEKNNSAHQRILSVYAINKDTNLLYNLGSGAELARVRGVRPNPSIFRGGFSNLSIFGPLEQTISNLEVYMRWEGT